MRHLHSRPTALPSSVLGTAVLAVWMVVCWGIFGVEQTTAQTSEEQTRSLAERYEAAHRRLLVRRQLQRTGGADVLPLISLPTPTDSLRPSDPQPPAEASQETAFPVRQVRRVSRLEREWFRGRFLDGGRSFLGTTPEYTFVDTTRTADLRARLQAEYGDPTQTLADVDTDSVDVDTLAQFEYWFVVNDSIAVRVTDSRGPRGRGLILSAQRKYREHLRALRKALLAPLQNSERAPYVDYYYDRRLEAWHRTGFDGSTFFLEQISQHEVTPGRRPRLDSTTVHREGPSSHSESPEQ